MSFLSRRKLHYTIQYLDVAAIYAIYLSIAAFYIISCCFVWYIFKHLFDEYLPKFYYI